MTETAHTEADANPFPARSVLVLVLFGALVFVLLLWAMGTGQMGGSANDGGDHAEGKGLNGYAALAGFLDKRGFTVRRSKSKVMLDKPGLLVLTPPHGADPKELDRIVGARQIVGPTMVVIPKWQAMPVPAPLAQGKQGWVMLGDALPVEWKGFRDDLSLAQTKGVKGARAGWSADGLAGPLPDARAVQSGVGRLLIPLVESRTGGRVLAGYIDDGGYYPGLEAIALRGPDSDADNEDIYPLIVVFEPDLLDNFGMGNRANALLGERLVRAASGDSDEPVTFDLTLNGHARSVNLLTLAFTPPFLAATLCLLLAALAIGWRAFLRFGPPRRAGREIAFGKRALVANAAGLIRRSRRLHLIAPPFVQAARDRLVQTLALPRVADSAASEAAIDRALAARAPLATPFSVLAARLRSARKPQDMLAAARAIHSLERTIKP